MNKTLKIQGDSRRFKERTNPGDDTSGKGVQSDANLPVVGSLFNGSANNIKLK